MNGHIKSGRNPAESFSNYLLHYFADIDKLDVPECTDMGRIYIFKQSLYVSLLDCLSNFRFNKKNYPSLNKKNKKRFIRFLIEYTDWHNGALVNLPFLKHELHELGRQDFPFYNYISAELDKFNPEITEIRSARIDKSISDLQEFVLKEKEEVVLNECQHYSIMYRYRNYLVHEARRPGQSLEWNSSIKTEPSYQRDEGEIDFKLLYPVEFMKNLVSKALDNFNNFLYKYKINPDELYKDSFRY